MRPFRFFFGTALALIIFFFLAKVFIMAFVIAAVLSGGYLLVRKIKSLFWRHYAYEDYDDFGRNIPAWENRHEPLVKVRRKEYERMAEVRHIHVQ